MCNKSSETRILMILIPFKKLFENSRLLGVSNEMWSTVEGCTGTVWATTTDLGGQTCKA